MQRILTACMLVGLLITSIAPLAPQTAQAREVLPAVNAQPIVNEYGQLPLYFEENRGQFEAEVQYMARAGGYHLFLTPSEALFGLKAQAGDEAALLSMRLLEANPSPSLVGENLQAGQSNYLIGNQPEKWHTDIRHYSGVRYIEVYSGIDLLFYTHPSHIQYDFILQPSADPATIQMQFEGAALEIAENGDLLIHMGDEILRQAAPYTYQDIRGQRQLVESRFIQLSPQVIGFEVGAYNPQYALVIDPSIVYSTYLGGTNFDRANAITVGGSGNTYIVGQTDSFNFPVFTAYQTDRGGADGFITKFNPTGTGLVFSTYLGGGSADYIHDVAIDATGAIYVTGQTLSGDFPTSASAPYKINGGGWDAFVVKLNAVGNTLAYGMYLGGSQEDIGYGIALDSSNNAYVTGSVVSNNFPVTVGAFRTTQPGGTAAFISKVNAAGTALSYSTYLGGSSTDAANAIAVNAAGQVFVTGYTLSTNFPTLNPFRARQPGQEAFITKLNAAGSALVYSSYIGGNLEDVGNAIAIDSSDAAYITGYTNSTNFPTSVGAFQTTAGGAADAFVSKINAAGSAIVYSTYIGGTLADVANDIKVSGSGFAYVTGYTSSANFPTLDPLQVTNPGTSAFVTVLNTTGTGLRFSSSYGGSATDEGTGIALLNADTIFIAGYTVSDNFPRTTGVYQSTYRGQGDAFVARISLEGNSTPNALALFNQNTGSVSLLSTMADQPPANTYTNFTINPLPPIGGQWVMGDWNGDGQKTPGRFSGGAFFYTNTLGVSNTWSSAWIGPSGFAVAGRFDVGRPNDCVGVFEQASMDGFTVFVLWYICDFSTTTPPVNWHWASAMLYDTASLPGLAGNWQFAVGDWDNNGSDTIASRRGPYIAWSNVPIVNGANVNTGAEFAFAQYFGIPSTFDYGVFVAGDWNNTNRDGFGILYGNNFFYYRNDLEWNSGIWELQRITNYVGSPRNVMSWNLKSGFNIGTAFTNVLDGLESLGENLNLSLPEIPSDLSPLDSAPADHLAPLESLP